MDVKKEFDLFIKACESQWKCGGKRYALEEDKEFTDLVCEVAGNIWIGGNIVKYAGEIVNTLKYDGVAQEVNFFKIAVYSYIWWLKEFKHPTTGIRLKVKHWPEFVKALDQDIKLIFLAGLEARVITDSVRYQDFITLVKSFDTCKKDWKIARIAGVAFIWWLQNKDKFTQRDEGEEFSFKGKIDE